MATSRFSLIIYSFLIHLFLSITSFGSDLSSESKQRPFETFMKENHGSNSELILIIGGGHKVNGPYPINYFLLDISSDQKPDLETNICTPISTDLLGKFDVVILEHLPMNCIPSAMNNVHNILKSGGKLIFNNICTVALNANNVIYDNATEILVENVKYYKINSSTTYDHNKTAFRMYVKQGTQVKYDEILSQCQTKVLDPFLASYDFEPTQKLTENPYRTTFHITQTILKTIKK